MLYGSGLFEAILENKKIKIGNKTIEVTRRFGKRAFLESLNDLGKRSEQEYFEYFGCTPMAIGMYPTIKEIKEKNKISYKALSNIGNPDLSKILGHCSTDTTLKYYKNYNDESNKKQVSKIWKEPPPFEYLEFMIWFGDNEDLYNKLKPLREDAQCSWKEMKKIKWKDINFENKTIAITNDEIDI